MVRGINVSWAPSFREVKEAGDCASPALLRAEPQTDVLPTTMFLRMILPKTNQRKAENPQRVIL